MYDLQRMSDEEHNETIAIHKAAAVPQYVSSVCSFRQRSKAETTHLLTSFLQRPQLFHSYFHPEKTKRKDKLISIPLKLFIFNCAQASDKIIESQYLQKLSLVKAPDEINREFND